MTKEGGPHLPVLTVSPSWVLQADQLPGLHNVSMPVTNYNTGDWILPLTAVVGTGSPQGALVFALPGCSSLTNLASKMPLESQGPGFTPLQLVSSQGCCPRCPHCPQRRAATYRHLLCVRHWARRITWLV